MNNFAIALNLGKAAYIGIWLAASYYFSRSALTYAVKQPSLAGMKSFLQPLVQHGRVIHPYIGLAVMLLFPYHGLAMFTFYGFSLKTVAGICTSVAGLITMALGLTLWRNRANMPVRLLHRRLMFLLLAAAIWHFLIKA